jgi:biotin synthase
MLINRTETDWLKLSERVLGGLEIDREQAKSILLTPDEEILGLLAGAYRLRREFFGNTVQLYFLMNAKSGLCPEDCNYCSQSKVSEAEIPRYNLLNREKLLDGARVAAERDSKTYCIVISARGPTERELKAVEEIVPEIKSRYDLQICACLGLLQPEHAIRLKAAGVDKVNHHQRRFLREDLHDAHLRRSSRHIACRSSSGPRHLQRWDHRNGRVSRRHRFDGI